MSDPIVMTTPDPAPLPKVPRVDCSVSIETTDGCAPLTVEAFLGFVKDGF